jgi:hypothetical protein
VTISKKGNHISSGAHFSGLPGYTSPVIYGLPLIEKSAKYSKKCGAVENLFPKKCSFFISSDAEFSSEYASSMMHHSFLIRKKITFFHFPNMERPVTVMVLQTKAEKLNWTGV